MPYTHFRYIGYQVPTASPGASAALCLSGWDPGPVAPVVASIPVPAGLSADSTNRLRRLAWVVDQARQKLSAAPLNDDTTTLKVFVAPEFYLRPPSTAGAGYNHNTYSTSERALILQALDSMFAHAFYTDWVIVCGTMMWNSLVDVSINPLYFNTAIIVQGGVQDGLHVVEKQAPSQLDGVPVVTVDAITYRAGPGQDPDLRPFFESWPVRKRHIIDIGGVQIGVEVCLDHLVSPTCRVLKRVVADPHLAFSQGPNPGVQLHILTAGGMPMNAASVAARTGGYLLRNDGMVSGNPRIQSWRVNGWTGPLAFVPYGADDLDGVPNGAFDNPASTWPIPPAGQIAAPPGPYATMPQQLVFHFARPLP